jgi:hypothetical protein
VNNIPSAESDCLYLTYPEDNSGHNLITCLKCGAVYAVTIAEEVYVGPPLDNKLKGLDCSHCGSSLEGNYAYYPETYIASGKKHSYCRPTEIPPDDQSIVKEFEGIYE